jgi:hypothetical protein
MGADRLPDEQREALLLAEFQRHKTVASLAAAITRRLDRTRGAERKTAGANPARESLRLPLRD